LAICPNPGSVGSTKIHPVKRPTHPTSGVTESGKKAVEARGVKFLRMEAGVAVYEVVSGAYVFRWAM
jgi:hypothetical protein